MEKKRVKENSAFAFKNHHPGFIHFASERLDRSRRCCIWVFGLHFIGWQETQGFVKRRLVFK